jgi:molybdopterin-dependent oxidoreductase alpha subunit
MTMPRQPDSDDSVERESLRIKAPPRHAAGVAAIASAIRHSAGQAGPVRAARLLAGVNQVDGFDCPGCAWPDPARRHHAEFCENGAKAIGEEATKARADPDLFAQWSVADLRARSDHWLGKRGRLTHPLLLEPGGARYRPISWEAAYAVIAAELKQIGSADEAVFYTSGRASNEAAFAYQAFARALGTNNLPDCSNLCHESSGVALTQTIGVGKGTVTLEDIEAADLVLVVGQNPGTNHPRMLSSLERAKRAGARIISINPLREAGLVRFDNPQKLRGLAGRGTRLADVHAPLRLNGDLMLFKAINHVMVREGWIDSEFVARHCEGFEELRDELSSLDWGAIEAATGIEPSSVRDLATVLKDSRRTVVCWAMGLTQHANAVATIREVVNFVLLRGMIGRRGAGLCPVRGHSNVQGDRTMGIWERPSEAFLDRLEAGLGFAMPRAHGYDVVAAIEAMQAGEVRVFMALGGNFAAAAPDTALTHTALSRCRLTVHISTKPNRTHLAPGQRSLILPTLGRTDRDQPVTVEDSMGVVRFSRGTERPPSPELRSEVRIICEIAQRALGSRVPIEWGRWASDYNEIRRAVARSIDGFEQFAQMHQGTYVLPHPVRDSLRFPTACGRARLTVNESRPLEIPSGKLLLQTLRSHDQFNTTVYGLNDRYRGVRAGRRVILVNPADLDALGLQDGSIVDLCGEGGRVAPRFRCVAYDTPKGCAAAYFPETNVLVPLNSVAIDSNTPTYKSVLVSLRLAEPA